MIRNIRFLFCWLGLLFPLAGLGNPSVEQSGERFTVSGFIYEEGSRESLIGATIFIPELRTGTISNNYGFYSITLPAGTVEFIFSYVGYQTQTKTLQLNQHTSLDIFLTPVIELEAVEVRADRVERISESVQMSRIDLPVQQIRQIPAFLGEKDLFKVIQLLPGVQSAQEGSSGFYVRGGGPDQNLVILDDAIVYNASHLFGFFSIFNGDAIKNVQLYKGGFPARFGGRLSSVLDISMKDGNKQQFGGEAGIGIVSSRLMLEGPLLKDRASFLVSGRRTYIDALIRPFMTGEGTGGYFFYDLNAKLHFEANRRNRFYLSGYFGRDKFFFRLRQDRQNREEGGLYWQNATTTFRWNHLFSDRLFANTSVIYSDYTLRIYMEDHRPDERFELSYSSGIRDLGLKFDLSWHPSPNHLVRAGFQSTYHRFTPSAFVLRDDMFNEFIQEVQRIPSLESGLYVEDEIRLGDMGKIHPGFRLSHFIHDQRSYFRPEPRLSMLMFLGPGFSWKASFASMNQYVHLLSTTGVGLPTDLWVPSTKNIRPQSTWQVATGLAKDFFLQGLELSLEGYYKKSDHVIGYREGASFLLIDDPTGAETFSWEDNITSGQAWSYGLEFLAQRKSGRLSGWLGYTLSWTQMQFDEVNNGNPFWARYDRRHDISLVGIFELSRNITLSATWVYSTGNAITLPLGTYAHVTHNPLGHAGEHFSEAFSGANTPFHLLPWQYINDYGGRNEFRAGSYHRLDLGVQDTRTRPIFGRDVRRTIELSVYNAYNRKNPFFYFIERGPTGSSLKQMTLFPIIPSLSVNYKF